MTTQKIKSIDAFIAAHLSDKFTSDYCRTEARILNSFFKRLIDDHGYSIRYVYDGGEFHNIADNDRFDALYHIFSVDSCRVSIWPPEDLTASIMLYMTIGEGEAQTICDHSDMPEDTEEMIFKLWAECVKTHDVALYNDNWR